MMVRNYAKQTCGLFTRTTAKIGAMTVLQYVNFYNHQKIGHVDMIYLNSTNGLKYSESIKNLQKRERRIVRKEIGPTYIHRYR